MTVRHDAKLRYNDLIRELFEVAKTLPHDRTLSPAL
jgi:hypothetical protein